MTARPSANRETSLAQKETDHWAKFAAAEFEAKLAELRKLIDSGTQKDRSRGRQLTETNKVDSEPSTRDDSRANVHHRGSCR